MYYIWPKYLDTLRSSFIWLYTVQVLLYYCLNTYNNKTRSFFQPKALIFILFLHQKKKKKMLWVVFRSTSLSIHNTCVYFHGELRKIMQISLLSGAIISIWTLRVNMVLTKITYKISGPSCSKLTMSLVNDSLKFTLSDTQICWNFLLKKCEWLLQCKSYSHSFAKKYYNIVYWIY